MTMKQNLLKTIAIGLLAMVGVNAWAEDVTVVLPAIQDGFARYDNSTVTYGIASGNHIEVKYETDKNFYGLLCFDIPAKTGYTIKSVSLRLVSKKISANRQTNFYKLNTDITTSPKFSDLSTAITTATATAAIGTVKAEGESGKQISSDAISADKYKTITLWQNTITLDKAQVTAGEKLNLLIATSTDAQSSNSNANRFFGMNTVKFTNSNISLTCYATELIPLLTVTYEVADDYSATISQPTADLYVRSDEAAKVYGTGNLEILNNTTDGKYFYGMMSFDVAAPAAGYEIVSATLRLTTRVRRGDITAAVYAINATPNESTTTYNGVSSAITTAMESAAQATFTMAGNSGNKALTDDGLSNNYMVASSWQQTADLTDYAKTCSGKAMPLLIAMQTASTNSSQFFAREITDQTIHSNLGGATMAASDLKPQLTVVYKKMDGYKLPVTSAGAATLCLPFDATIPTSGNLKAYTLSYSSGDNITATQITSGTLKANTPALITADENASGYEFTRTGDITSGDPTSGVLVGNYTYDFVVPANYYILTKHGDEVAFRKANGTTNKVQPYRAYMTATYTPGTPAPEFLNIVFDGNVTVIDAVEKKPVMEDGEIYNLQGVRMNGSNLPKGIYVKNGKKYIVK